MAGWADVEELLGRPVLEAAPGLLGATLTVGEVTVRITEVEAYDGANDPGSHAYRGRTARNATMFGPAGHLYCYLIYGMHVCANVVCGPSGRASAVLLRAGEVLAGEEVAAERRGVTAGPALARGPANLVRSLGLARSDDGMPLADHLRLGSTPVPAEHVRTGPRVGLRQAAERPWRFWVAGDPTVSAYRPATTRVRSRARR